MRVTLDTNVLVSAFISRQGNPARILEIITTFDEFSLVLSEEILTEFKDVLNRAEVSERFHYSQKDVEDYATAVRDVATVIDIQSKFRIVKEDPKDDIILQTAVDGKVDFVVSGDGHLKQIKEFRNVKIVNPKQFLLIIVTSFGELIS
jgi:uncharacterized protein